jgi:hypothetical protein
MLLSMLSPVPFPLRVSVQLQGLMRVGLAELPIPMEVPVTGPKDVSPSKRAQVPQLLDNPFWLGQISVLKVVLPREHLKSLKVALLRELPRPMEVPLAGSSTILLKEH